MLQDEEVGSRPDEPVTKSIEHLIANKTIDWATW